VKIEKDDLSHLIRMSFRAQYLLNHIILALEPAFNAMILAAAVMTDLKKRISDQLTTRGSNYLQKMMDLIRSEENWKIKFEAFKFLIDLIQFNAAKRA